MRDAARQPADGLGVAQDLLDPGAALARSWFLFDQLQDQVQLIAVDRTPKVNNFSFPIPFGLTCQQAKCMRQVRPPGEARGWPRVKIVDLLRS